MTRVVSNTRQSWRSLGQAAGLPTEDNSPLHARTCLAQIHLRAVATGMEIGKKKYRQRCALGRMGYVLAKVCVWGTAACGWPPPEWEHSWGTAACYLICFWLCSTTYFIYFYLLSLISRSFQQVWTLKSLFRKLLLSCLLDYGLHLNDVTFFLKGENSTFSDSCRWQMRFIQSDQSLQNVVKGFLVQFLALT